MPHFGFLFAAYTLVWVALFLYLRSLASRNRDLERQLGELRELLERSGRVSPGDEPR